MKGLGALQGHLVGPASAALPTLGEERIDLPANTHVESTLKFISTKTELSESWGFFLIST